MSPQLVSLLTSVAPDITLFCREGMPVTDMINTTRSFSEACMAPASAPAVHNGPHALSEAFVRPDAEVTQMLNSDYAYASNFFQEGLLDEAEGFFHYLCTYHASNPDYVLGLAATYQLKKQYVQAIDSYRRVQRLKRGAIRPMFFEGQCHLMLGQFESAKRCFKACLSSDDAGVLRIAAQRYLTLIARQAMIASFQTKEIISPRNRTSAEVKHSFCDVCQRPTSQVVLSDSSFDHLLSVDP